MGGSDSHAQQNSYYSTAQHYHRRNWLPLFYLLIDAAITNSYILYKLFKGPNKRNRLTHVQFQESVARGLLRGPGAILRRRQPRHPCDYPALRTSTVRKEAVNGHTWGKLGTYRQCAVYTPYGKPGGAQRRWRRYPAMCPTAGNEAGEVPRGPYIFVPDARYQSVIIRIAGTNIWNEDS
jgi:hypothetical protein